MKYVCTIASKGYKNYLLRFLYSVRAAGWRGEIVVITPDPLYCNERVIVIKSHFRTDVFNDSRWLKLELDRFFKKGDRVIFLDCDIVLYDGFPFKELFKHDLSMTTVPIHHDGVKEMPVIEELLGIDCPVKYLASPIAFRVCKRAKDFFKLWRAMRPASMLHRKGTMFALNMACYNFDMSDVYLLPNDRCLYTLDYVFEELDRVPEPVLMHYGGWKGKRIWKEEYESDA